MTVNISLDRIDRNLILTANNKQFSAQAASDSEQASLLKKFDLFINDQLAISEIHSKQFNKLVQDVDDAIRSNIKKSEGIHFELQGQNVNQRELTITQQKWSELKKLCQAANDYSDKILLKYRGKTIAYGIFAPLSIAGTALFYTLGVPALSQLLNTGTVTALQAANNGSIILLACAVALIMSVTLTGALVASSCSLASLKRQRVLLQRKGEEQGDVRGARVSDDDSDIVQAVPVVN